eukprot:CAMPEP_0172463204 /NCGR_PEP_ID=MMETSP1065-20121228/46323_1 /TAXON_ID=265537 /ORGANISM="Amphiprora paludosa, Strain CCMP125" /LENGTH=44 /DNA_ID= /DNA_START= /DNA_END= /DNA_ORIENTATION=
MTPSPQRPSPIVTTTTTDDDVQPSKKKQVSIRDVSSSMRSVNSA